MAIFPKGLTHGFSPKMTIFPTFFVQAIQARKMSLTIFQNEKTPFQAIKTRSSKSRKIYIFSKRVNPCFWSKNGDFTIFFLGIIGQENVFYDMRERKNAFLRCKKKKFKKSKMAIFPKGLTHGFGPKMIIFPTFFVQAI